MLDRKAKSFEEREQEYEKAKRRIFKDMNSESIEQFWQNWHSGESLNSNNLNKNSSSGKNNSDAAADEDYQHQHQHQHQHPTQVKEFGQITTDKCVPYVHQ